MAWKFTAFGETFREAELTLGQAEQIESLMAYVDAKGNAVRPHWGQINPLLSAKAAVCTVTVMYAARAQIAVDDARSKVTELPMVKFIDDVDLNDDDDLPSIVEDGHPLSADEDSTTT